MILVTLGNGKTAQHVIPELVKRGLPVRVIARNPKGHDALKALGAKEVVSGDLLDRAFLKTAFAGIDQVVHVGPPLTPDEPVIGKFVADAAKAAGVKHFIYISVIHPEIDYLLNHRNKRLIQDYLISSRMNWTFLQPQHYMQNVYVGHVVHEGRFSLPYSMQRKLAFVDLQDLAEVTGLVAAEGAKHYFASYELCAADYLSGDEIAQIISRVTGKSIASQSMSVKDFIQFFETVVLGGTKISDGGQDAFHRLFDYYDRYGITGNPNVLSWLLGRAPTSMEQYIKRELARSA